MIARRVSMPVALFRTGHHDLGIGRRVLWQRGHGLRDVRLAHGLVHLVGLGHHHLKGHGRAVQQRP